MNSYILLSKTQQPKTDYLLRFYKDHNIDLFDQINIDGEGSIGIEVVRKLQEIVFLKPYKSEKKVIIIDNAQNLTTEAQNGLLKLLEEPPLFIVIFLLSTSEDTFLPTILSRCSVIKLLEEKATKDRDTEKMEEDFSVFQGNFIAEKLALAEKLASDKENLPGWFEDIIYFVREKMINDSEKENQLTYASLLLSLQEAYKTYTTTNVNPRIILEHTFLHLIMSS